ncbi:hypothetical protein ACHQM5_025981 [Ranunculus cassubicifolius]
MPTHFPSANPFPSGTPAPFSKPIPANPFHPPNPYKKIIEISERLLTMGIAVNLVTYLVGTMHLPSSTSANIVTDFMGTSFLLCLLGGFLSDSYLGRYKTIAIFALVQTLGTGILAVSTKLPDLHPPPCINTSSETCEPANGFQMGILYMSLYLIALGTGGLKSSASGVGTDQFDDKDEKEKTQMAYFFNRFVFFISMGTLTAVTVLVYIQDEVGRSFAYGICSVTMFICVLIFLSGTKRYRYKKGSGSPFVQILQVIVVSINKRKLNIPSSISLLYEDSPQSTRIHHTDQFRCLDKAAIVAEGDFTKNGSSSPNPWKLCSVTRIEEVKMMVKLLPVWATTIIFWTTYAQMITFSVEQATTMERSIGDFQIPAGSLTVFFVGAILLPLAIYDRLIMPFWKKWKGKQGFSNLQRIAIRLAMSTIGMAAAALVERRRLSVAKTVGVTSSTLPISVFLLIPRLLSVAKTVGVTTSDRNMAEIKFSAHMGRNMLFQFIKNLWILGRNNVRFLSQTLEHLQRRPNPIAKLYDLVKYPLFLQKTSSTLAQYLPNRLGKLIFPIFGPTVGPDIQLPNTTRHIICRAGPS